MSFRILRSIFVSAIVSITSLSMAQQYPERTVKIVGPGAGSGTDLTARILAKSLAKIWQQSVIIENRPGAGGTLGISSVVNAPGDGYTLLAQSATYVINPAVYKNQGFDVLKSLVDIDMIATTPYILVTAASNSAQHVKGLIQEAKAKPGDLTFSSAGVGSSTHLASEYFNQVAGIKGMHIPYKSTPEALQDVISARVTYMMAPYETAITHIKSGKLRARGLSSKVRSEISPQIPTIAEQLDPNFDINFWVGIWAPMATPDNIVQKINADISKALQDPETKTSFTNAGITVRTMGQQQFAKYVREEIARYKVIAGKAGITPQ